MLSYPDKPIPGTEVGMSSSLLPACAMAICSPERLNASCLNSNDESIVKSQAALGLFLCSFWPHFLSPRGGVGAPAMKREQDRSGSLCVLNGFRASVDMHHTGSQVPFQQAAKKNIIIVHRFAKQGCLNRRHQKRTVHIAIFFACRCLSFVLHVIF